MATDIAALRAKVVAERQIVVEELALIDIPAEQARYDAAEATHLAAENTFNKASRRWQFVENKQNRLLTLDAEIALLTP